MLYVVSAVLLLSACNGMENVPTNKFTDNSYWTSEAKAQNVVNMAYSQMYDAGKMWSDESLSDNVIDGRTVTDQRAIRKGQATPSVGVFSSEWQSLYGGIKTCHVFLDKVDLIPNMNPSAKARMIAEIRFIRAAIYFRLVNFYGDIPFFTKDIPLICRPKSWNCYIFSHPLPIRYSPENSFWTISGDMNTSVTPEPWTSISSGFGRKSKMMSTGPFPPSGELDTNLR